MVNFKQLPMIIMITNLLRKKEMSIAELSRELKMKRSTLNYYLKILEQQDFISRERIQKKKTGRPTIIKFNMEKYSHAQKEILKIRKEEEEKILNEPLTINILNTIKKKPNPCSMKDIHTENLNAYGIGFRLNWLIEQGLIINEFKLTPEGEQFLKEHSKG